MAGFDDVPRLVLDVAERCHAAGGRAWLVGGGVRDGLLGRAVKDWDVEVHHLPEERLFAILQEIGRVDPVGRAFGVLRVTKRGLTIDVSLPRRDSKAGPGHRGIAVQGDPDLGLVEATRRRDLTINAILRDVRTGAFADPFDGRRDLADQVLRAVDVDTFLEDPLRALRAAQLAARLDFTPHPTLVTLCAAASLDELPKERIRGEWEKLLLQGVRPSRGLGLLREAGQLARLFPTLTDAPDAPLDALASRRDAYTPDGRRFTLMLAGWLRATRPAGAEAVLGQLGVVSHGGYPTRDKALAAVQHLTDPIESDVDLRRLATVAEPAFVLEIRRADGAPVDSALERVQRMGVQHAPEPPLLLGRDLLALGWKPGPSLGDALARAYEAQITEVFRTREAALAWARDAA